MNNILGWAATITAFILNVILEEEVNQMMTYIISALSMVYLSVKITREIKAFRDELQHGKHKKGATDNDRGPVTDTSGDSERLSP